MLMNMFDFIFEVQLVILTFIAYFYVIHRKPKILHIVLLLLVILIPTSIMGLHYYVNLVYTTILSSILFYYYLRSVFSIITYGIIIIITNVTFFSFKIISTYGGDYLGILKMPVALTVFYLLYWLLAYIYKRFIFQPYYKLEMPIWMKGISVCFLIVTIIVIYINTDHYVKDEFNANFIVLMSYFVVVNLLYFLLMAYLKRLNEVDSQVEGQDQFLEYMKELELVNFDMHKFRHDYINILLTMRGYLDENNLEGLRKYFNEHIIKVEQETLAQHFMFTQFKNIKIQELKGLIATKLIAAEKKNILINVEIPDLITEIHMEKIDLARIIGVLLDNAIEESVNLHNPAINVGIIHSIDGDVVILIENKTSNHDLNISELFSASFSTKGKHRGLGLHTVQTIINDYTNVQLDTKIEQDWFIQKLRIKPKYVVSPENFTLSMT